MNTDQLDMVESLHRAGVKPQEIKAALREKFPGVQPALKYIYNHTAKIRRDGLLGDTPMKALENFLAGNGFTFYIRESDTDDRTEEIFFCYSKSHKMWRAFPEVLMVDTTYNTNMYDWPLIQFIGVTSTSQSFCIAAAFVIRERQRNFGWALEKLKQMLYDCMEPRVILTDADQALMNACDAVFPNATKNLCRWHISENIRRKFKGLYSTKMGTNFAYWWKVLYQSPWTQEYDHRRLNMERHLIRDDRAKVWQYIRKSWLDPYKHKFVACWIDERRNYGETTTNRVESQHANLKRYLNGISNSLDTIARQILKMVNSQMKEIGKSFEASRSKVMEGHRQHVWLKKLINRVSIHALGLLVNEYGLIHKMRDGGASCDHHLYSSSGLPCACRIEGYIVNDTCIPIEDVDPFWRRLNFDPTCPPNEEPDYAACLRDITDTLSSIDDPNQKKSFFARLLSAIPGRSKKKELEKREDPRGRPKKPDPPRHSAYTPAPDLPRHSSYNLSSSEGPSQENPTPSSLNRSLSQSASRFKTPRGRPMGAHLGFPLMVSPAQVPAIEMFRSVIPSWAQPFVADIKNVRPDGNCGFRSIAVGLGIHEKV
ncbi:PKS-NRPS hybrid synthetase cheA-like [Bidens hawaiensis]|uniref:PKS-NRPS hybrid synthetase cheA-like n=1 Tax=Bidens hawaiensis TaxID=980011 RepID=UPI0040497E88